MAEEAKELRDLEMRVVERVRTMKCRQKECLSQRQDNLEVAVFGEGLPKSGLMCTSCFIDDKLHSGMKGPISRHALPFRKFMQILTSEYMLYHKSKKAKEWAPNIAQSDRELIMAKLSEFEMVYMKGILDILAYIENATKEAEDQLKQCVENKDSQRMMDLVVASEERPGQVAGMDCTNCLKTLAIKIMMIDGQYRYNDEEVLSRKIDKIYIKMNQKIQLAEKTLSELVNQQKKLLKFLHS